MADLKLKELNASYQDVATIGASNTLEDGDGNALSTINAATMLQIGGEDILSTTPISWTPAYSPASGSFGTITYNIQQGKAWYIGTNVLLLYYELRTSELVIGTASGLLTITGLPETPDSTLLDAFNIPMTQVWAGTSPKSILISSTGLTLRDTEFGLINVSAMTTGAGNANRIKGTMLCAF